MLRERAKIEVCEITGEEFYISQEQIEAYDYFDLPLPKVAPEERFRHQLAFRNDQQFFWRRCSASNKRILSIFPTNAPFPVVDLEYWRGKEFNPLIHGRDFDFSKLFVEQLLDLWFAVPRPAVSTFGGDSSLAVHAALGVRDSFMVFNARDSSKCMYATYLSNCRQCIDCHALSHCRMCYECVHCVGCTSLRWGSFSTNCKDSWFLKNCHDCRDCLFCTNLKGKRFHVFNQPVTEEVFRKTVADWDFGSRAKVELARERFVRFLADKPVPHLFTDDPSTTSGNYLHESTKAFNCYECFDSTNLLDCNNLFEAEHCLEGFGLGEKLENCAQFVSVGGAAKNVINCIECWGNVSDLMYCSHCEDSRHLFACVGLRGKEYCIFNKQYSKSDYESLRTSIVNFLKERRIWGRFFPAQFSGHAYNNSSANLYMPLTKVTAKMMGFDWDDSDAFLSPSELLSKDSSGELYQDVPAKAADLDDSKIKNAVYLCELTGKPFTISSDEAGLYKRLNIAPPVRAFEQRNLERIRSLAPRRLTVKGNEETGEFETAFPEDWAQPVLHYYDWLELLESGKTGKKR